MTDVEIQYKSSNVLRLNLTPVFMIQGSPETITTIIKLDQGNFWNTLDKSLLRKKFVNFQGKLSDCLEGARRTLDPNKSSRIMPRSGIIHQGTELMFE